MLRLSNLVWGTLRSGAPASVCSFRQSSAGRLGAACAAVLVQSAADADRSPRVLVPTTG